MTGASTTTTTNPTCLEDGAFGCHLGGSCCEPDLCEASLCFGSFQASRCNSCIASFDASSSCLTAGCTTDADCCDAGHACVTGCGILHACVPSNGCAPTGFPCCAGDAVPCCNGVCPADGGLCP
jgi:hypothetical protein